jgi:hypothetical protein
MFFKRQIAVLAILAGCAAASGASAATAVWPTSIVGTWKGMSNQTAITLTITSQTAGGKCQLIAGTLTNVGGGANNILGYYCPSSGNVEFLREPLNSNQAYQVYNASVNQNHAGAPHLMIAGTFGQYSLAYGPLGQYSFSVFN